MDISKVKPIGKRILVKITKKEQQKGGILLVAEEQHNYVNATVVAIGSVENLNVGDSLLIPRYFQNKIEDEENKETYGLIIEDEVLGVFA